MRILELELKDWGRHKYLKKEIDAQVVGLIGPNGSGKTTILKAVEFAINGTLPKSAGNLDTFVRDMWQQGGPNNGHVKLKFEKDGQIGTIFRQVGKTSKRYLEWGGKTTTKAKEVEDLMEDILGADRQAISSAVFISQGELDKFMFGTPAEREELFQKLMLLNFMDKRADMLTKKIEIVGRDLQDFSMQKDELQQQRYNIELSLAEKEMELQKTPNPSNQIEEASKWLDADDNIQYWGRKMTLDHSEIREAKSVEHKYTERLSELALSFPVAIGQGSLAVEGARKALTEATNRYNSIRMNLDNKKSQSLLLKELASDRQSLQRVNDLLAPLLSKFDKEEMVRLKEEENMALRRASLMSEKEKWQTDWSFIAHSEHNLDAKKKELSGLSEVISSLRTAHSTKKFMHDVYKQLSEYNGEGDCTCPLCRQPADGLVFDSNELRKLEDDARLAWQNLSTETDRERLLTSEIRQMETDIYEARRKEVESRNELSRINKELESTPSTEAPELISSKIREMTETESKINSYQQVIGQLTTKCRQAEELLKGYGDIPDVTDKDLDNAMDFSKRLEEAVKEIEDTARNLDRSRSNVEACMKAMEKSKAEFDKAQESIATLSRVGLSDRSEVEEKLTNLKEILAQHHTIAGEVKQIKAHRDLISQRQRELEDRIKGDDRKRALIEQLRRLRDTFSRGGLPMSYMAYQFQLLVDLAQEYLVEMDAQFSISVDPDSPLGFNFMRVDDADGIVLPHSKLSGGQRVRLAVSMLMAIQRLILPEVGLLVLDEPSVHLDTASVEDLKDLLINIGHRLGSTDMQVLVCDHQEPMVPAFGSVIRVA